MGDLDLSSFDLSDGDTDSEDLLTVLGDADTSESADEPNAMETPSPEVESDALSSMGDLDLSSFNLLDEGADLEGETMAVGDSASSPVAQFEAKLEGSMGDISLNLDDVPLDAEIDDEPMDVTDDLLLSLDDALANSHENEPSISDSTQSPEMSGLGDWDEHDDMSNLTMQMSALNDLAVGLDDEMSTEDALLGGADLDDLGDIEMIDLDEMDHDADLEEFTSTIQATLNELGVDSEDLDEEDAASMDTQTDHGVSSDFDATMELDHLLSELDDISKK